MGPLNERIVCTLVLGLAFAGPVGAQERFGPAPGPAFALFRPASTQLPARPVSFIHSSAPDYRWEGLVVGAVALGAVAAYWIGGLCGANSEGGEDCGNEAIKAGLIGAFGGGIIGGLIGGAMPKPAPKAPPDSTRKAP